MTQNATATSESEEMYLITIATAIEDGHSEPVPVSHVAKSLDVSGVSANQMVRKLAARGYLDYEPYRGVTLSEDGRRVASEILRRRRLWGVFLKERLGLTPVRADAVACDLEHVTPGDVADLLSGFLGGPERGPRGKAIPDSSGDISVPIAERLDDVAAGEWRSIATVDLDNEALAFVGRQGVVPGGRIQVLGVGADGDRFVSVDGACLHLATELAAGVLVVDSL
ncbi:MAG: metal-dependent transcriptional regulator [Actinomycetota bacterium]